MCVGNQRLFWNVFLIWFKQRKKIQFWVNNYNNNKQNHNKNNNNNKVLKLIRALI